MHTYIYTHIYNILKEEFCICSSKSTKTIIIKCLLYLFFEIFPHLKVQLKTAYHFSGNLHFNGKELTEFTCSFNFNKSISNQF